MAEALEEISTLEPAQSIQRVVASPGSCLFEVECANGLYLNSIHATYSWSILGIRSHASLPKKFRKTIYTKKRDYVICEPIFEGDKVKYEIVRFIP